jgi:hypothetical protein
MNSNRLGQLTLKLLPQTDVRLLRIVVVCMAMGSLWYAGTYLRAVASGQYYVGVFGFVMLLPLAAGLWLLMSWARYFSLFLLWAVVFVTPFNVGPFAVVDGESLPLPIWEQLMYLVAPLVIPSVFFIEVLCAYKPEFRWRRVSEATPALRTTPALVPRSWVLWCIAVFAIPVLLVAFLNLDIRIRGGCLPMSPAAHQGSPYSRSLWISAILACGAGLLIFLRAAPAKASRLNKVVRTIIYCAGMLWFYSNVSNYLMLTSFCDFHGP